MGLFKQLLDSIKPTQAPFNGFGYTNQPVEGNLPVFPEWFFTARIGQPRKINPIEVRNFSQSPWVQMVLNTIKKEVMNIDWDLMNADENDEQTYESEKKLVEDFLNNINSDSETIDDLHSMLITDLGEIDAGTLVKVFSNDSYEDAGEEPVYNEAGVQIGTQPVFKLKPLGQRRLLEIRAADGSTFLKQIDIYKRLMAYYQYSFKNPRTNPKRFDPEEVVYYCMNKKSYTLYGFSPVQSIQQVLETLIQATRWNKDFFQNNAIPDGIVSLPNANPEQLRNFKREVLNATQGKAHKLLFQNSDADFKSFANSARDMEWLEGQKWYFHLVFAVFGVSPVEAGFHENVNQGNQAGQERITVKNGIKPYLELFERHINRQIIPEILGDETPKIKFKYKPKEHVEEQIEFDQDMKQLEVGAMTINEYRKSRGLTPVEWGDEPYSSTPSFSSDNVASPQQDSSNAELDQEQKAFMKRFEGLLE